ncbi:KfrB domain-containing protein [Paraburkholderia fungorum]|uniref:KfrB domain-containing protein n=1 Tax=Paraburkholderia fungorum TaxID=134537 RepID=UPI00402BB83F
MIDNDLKDNGLVAEAGAMRKTHASRRLDPDVKRQRLNPLDGDAEGVSITFDGMDSYAVRFGYNPDLIAQIRRIPGADFDGVDAWRVPVAQYDALADVAASMRKEYLLDSAAHDGIVTLAGHAARDRQAASDVQPRLSDFHARGEAVFGEIIAVNDRYAAQFTGLGKRDGVAFVTLHRLADLSEAVFKGEMVSIEYDAKGRANVGQRRTAEEKFDASLNKSVDGVKVTEDGGQYKIEFDYNPALSDRIARIDGAEFKRDEKIWTVDANLKSFVARAVNEMRAEVVADRADRDQMIEVAAERIDSPKVHEAFTGDGKSYTGRVLAMNDRYVLQHSGKDHVTLHRAQNLDGLPSTVGENARFSYKGGRAQSRDLSRDRAIDEGLSR